MSLIMEALAFAAGAALGFIAKYIFGDALAVLLPFFLSATRELNPFWLGYLIGVAVAHVTKNKLPRKALRKSR